MIVVANYTTAAVYRQEGNDLGKVPLEPQMDTRFVRISPDGRWALTVRLDESVKDDGMIWNAQTGKRVKEIKVGIGAFFTPNGRWLTNGRARWEVGTWKEVPPLTVADGPTALDVCYDGALFADLSNSEVIPLVEIATGKTLVQLGLPEPSASKYAAFSRDGAHLIHQSEDHDYICAWDLRALRRQLAKLDLDWEAPQFLPGPENERRLPPVVTIEPAP